MVNATLKRGSLEGQHRTGPERDFVSLCTGLRQNMLRIKSSRAYLPTEEGSVLRAGSKEVICDPRRAGHLPVTVPMSFR
jgi:hypothetical protein